MIKVVPPDSWPFQEPTIQLVKWSSRGLIGADRDALVKRAGVGVLDALRTVEPLPGEKLAHLLML